MPNETVLREHVLALLEKEQAHAGFEKAVKNMPFELQGKRPQGAAHSPWEILEHMRIAQWDILEFSRDEKHVSPEFPQGYWPDSAAPASDAAWKKSVAAFRRDLEAMKQLVAEADERQLYARIAHGNGQTLLREALLVADHNAYHLGQLVFLRKMLEGRQ